MTKFETLQMRLADLNPKALFADGFEEALVGIAIRCGQPALAVYDYALAVEVLIQRDEMDYDEAVEFMDFNVTGAWMGEHTPIWLERGEDGADTRGWPETLEVFEQHGWLPVDGQPGLFKHKDTGEIGNIRWICTKHFRHECDEPDCGGLSGRRSGSYED